MSSNPGQKKNIPTNSNTGSSSCGGSGGAAGGSGGAAGGGGGPCGACKFLRRKCVPGCIFAPYFDSEQGAAHFAAVHKVFGASNVSKLLLQIPVHKRLDAVVTICYEAQARLRDPVYGCVGHIFALQQQVVNLQTEISYLQAHLATLQLPPPPPPPPVTSSQPYLMMPSPLSIADLPAASSFPAAYDISMLFDPLMQQPSAGGVTQQQHTPPPPPPPPPPPAAIRHSQHRQMDPRHFMVGCSPTSAAREGGNGDLQALARELIHRHGSTSQPPHAHGSLHVTDASLSRPPQPK
ncbi:hypothetical protein SAY86_019864 [Trapa natans]|uniref:LOB domain-containing protein n=1 Tax=Trapa natans TaxID=22666 RepID=A0AAN7LZJ9_TRANT|nr:hypothetical protein SAY86_019864 [Trapa natans]